jgi:peroxiredoxin/uncharacterized membrane protein YphA (DoxX/SURF4 family)
MGHSAAELTLLFCRLLLAAVFFVAGATKFVDPLGTLQALREFGVPKALSRPVVVLLPLLEVIVAVALIPASVAWYGACGAIGMLALFVMAIGVAMIRGRKPDCHCFGQLHSSPVGKATLLRNGLLAVGAIWIESQGLGHSGPEVWDWYSSLGVEGQKVTLVAAAVVGFLFLRAITGARPKVAEPETPSEPFSLENFWSDEPVPPAPPPPRPRSVEPVPEAPPALPAREVLNIGLPIGTPAPEFDLPGMNGENRSLESLRSSGRDVMLVFSSPYCPPCQALAPNLVRWKRELERSLNIVVVSRGSRQENLEKLKEIENLDVLLQKDFSVAESYDCNSTPAAVVVGADGLLRSGLATGREAIQQIIAERRKA